ncbi:PINc/VapC family ATPase [Ferroplasma acidiphilum]|uniref:Flp pilus assembly complex ATPase component TadA n=1 Tax=Ferroplasma acidiphilum TaxID=74969 RepID=A0A7K4FLW1_9ARCH|nr:PINc/VapC family ATPase [Ferroplasma acidiphilum]NOL60032.1 Flp pilus assembly complex ATPase component TadA [Ferroplasma acidiphilum]
MDYVPDTSVIVSGKFREYVAGKNDVRVILAEAMIAEIEHQANEGRSIGFTALEELKKLRELSDSGKIYIDIMGNRPMEWQIKNAHSGEIDNIIRNIALDNAATLVTGDHIQSIIASIKGINVIYIKGEEKDARDIQEFFDEYTSSVHLKAGMKPLIKTGKPGEVVLKELDYVVSNDELERIAYNIVQRGKFEDQSFIEMDMFGATVIQLKNLRIVITRPPFSDIMEITAVRPVVKTSIEDYKLDKRVMDRLQNKAYGILVAGSPGAGKSTFVTALAEYYASQNKIVKTMEKPRDLQVNDSITQYTTLEGDMEKTGDILLLVREDYTVFDEMRVTSDFKVYSDLRLAGVGMVGVVHSTRAVDAIQRFVGRIELGLIPQVVDTVLFIEGGKVSQVLTTDYQIKIPYGLNQEDLARPVIVIRDFLKNKPVSEIYTFGDQVVVIPVGDEKNGANPLFAIAAAKIREDMMKLLETDHVDVQIVSEGRVIIKVPDAKIPRLIGRKGETVTALEKSYGLKIDVDTLSDDVNVMQDALIEIKNKTIFIDVGSRNRPVKLYVDGIAMLSARSSAKGMIKLRINSDTGNTVYKYIKQGKKLQYMVMEESEPSSSHSR